MNSTEQDEEITEFQSETNKQQAVQDQIEAIRQKWSAEAANSK